MTIILAAGIFLSTPQIEVIQHYHKYNLMMVNKLETEECQNELLEFYRGKAEAYNECLIVLFDFL